MDILDAMLGGYFKLCFIMAKVGNLDSNLVGYLELFFIIDVGDLYTNIGSYFELSFVMSEVGNLHAK